jgi:hypothetical protein
MKSNSNRGLYAVAVAVAIVGAVWLGMPLGTLALLAIVVLCPLMMMFMMGGMHGGGHSGGSETRHLEGRDNPHDSTSSR